MTRVKICGVCSAADARVAEAAGADFVGVILAPGFRRSRSVEDAIRIVAPLTVDRVGVFVDAGAERMLDAAARLDLAVVQLHGDEDEGTVERVREGAAHGGRSLRIWKAVRVADPRDVGVALRRWQGRVDGLLLDGFSDRAHGGTGARFDWEAAAPHVRSATGIDIIAAGGLDAHNVARAIGALTPRVVDVSSGVEEEAGRKSPARVAAFIAAVRGTQVSAGRT